MLKKKKRVAGGTCRSAHFIAQVQGVVGGCAVLEVADVKEERVWLTAVHGPVLSLYM